MEVAAIPYPSRTNQATYPDVRGKSVLLIKLIFLGLPLPTLDLGTDLLAIYQYSISTQWVLNRLALGLAFSILSHNLVPAFYGRKTWDIVTLKIGENVKFASVNKFLSGICLAMGLGNVLVTIYLIIYLPI